MTIQYHKQPAIISILLLVLVLFLTFPIGVYSLLRVIVCGTNCYYAYISYKAKYAVWTWIFGFGALIFNFLIPFAFGKTLWRVIDVIMIIALVAFLYITKRK